MTPSEGDQFVDDTPELHEISKLAANQYNDYILRSENEEVASLLTAEHRRESGLGNAVNEFGKQAYSRVDGLFDRFDFEDCRRFVLVGCGSLPVTMFQVLDNTNVPEIVGLDIRPDAVQSANAIFEKDGLNRAKAVQSDGHSFDYAGADIVYVANMVSPKLRVLERILETASETVQIVLRDPYSFGRLWTERGEDALDERFEVLDYGPPSPAYFSRDVYIRAATRSA
ncbi:MAG: methyltransferase domain-containing protein [Pseudomonadota bacterium]